MAGALMQLVAYGAQDVYLTSEPTITFWKAVYRRHTNFAMESIAQTLTGSSGYGQTAICRISRNGDLMSRTWVEVEVSNTVDAARAVNRFGFALLKRVELRIGGQMIDRLLSTWMYIWSELTHTTDQKGLLNTLVGSGSGRTAGGTTFAAPGGVGTRQTFQIPLLFAYCRHPGLAIPLIALQYHEVEIQIEFEQAANCWQNNDTTAAFHGAQVWVDYIFLDTDERKEFAQKPHEYLIETVQNQALSATTDNRLTFNHPTKCLAWAAARATPGGAGDRFTDFTDNNVVALTNSQLKLNGQDRFATRTNAYFNQVQPYQHFSGAPAAGINVYSFAVKPEEHQPSGTCNFSRIDNTNLVTTVSSVEVTRLFVFALSYNVFRVASGMGGLAYSN